MSQISTPIRILLVGAIVLMAAWFTVLKPKDDAVVPPSAAPAAPGAAQSKAGEFAAKAKAGAATAEADAAGAANAGIEDVNAPAPAPALATPSQTGATTQTATPSAPALPALDPKSLEGLPKAIRTGLQERKVVVLGVLNTVAKPWAPMADDDRAVRNVLRKVNRYDGGVVVRTAPLGRLAKYDGLLKALQVTQSPTVVVVDRNRQAVALEGYVDRMSINQAIADARRGSIDKRIKDPYLRKINDLCGRFDLRVNRLSAPVAPGTGPQAIRRALNLSRRYRAELTRTAAPSKWRSLRARMISVRRADEALAVRLLVATKGSNAKLAAALAAMEGPLSGAAALDRRFNAVGLTSCAAKRTR